MTSYYQHAHPYAIPSGQGGLVAPYPNYPPLLQYASFPQRGGYYPWAYRPYLPFPPPQGEYLL